MDEKIVTARAREYEPTARDWLCALLLVAILLLAARMEDVGALERQAQEQAAMKEAGAWVMW